MVAVHVGKLHAAEELLLGEMLGNAGQVQSSLPVVALVQVIFVLEDLLGREGRGNPTSPACSAQFSPRQHTTHHPLAPQAALCQTGYYSPKGLQIEQEHYLAAGSPGSRITGDRAEPYSQTGRRLVSNSITQNLGCKRTELWRGNGLQVSPSP